MQISGIKSGAVMQRDENNQCRIIIRVDGVEELKTTLGSVKKVGDGTSGGYGGGALRKKRLCRRNVTRCRFAGEFA